MLGATVEQRHQNFLQRIYYLELKNIYIYISMSFSFLNRRRTQTVLVFFSSWFSIIFITACVCQNKKNTNTWVWHGVLVSVGVGACHVHWWCENKHSIRGRCRENGWGQCRLGDAIALGLRKPTLCQHQKPEVQGSRGYAALIGGTDSAANERQGASLPWRMGNLSLKSCCRGWLFWDCPHLSLITSHWPGLGASQGPGPLDLVMFYNIVCFFIWSHLEVCTSSSKTPK